MFSPDGGALALQIYIGGTRYNAENLVSSIVAVLPLTIGGIGSREFTFMLGAQWLGLDLNLSIALSFLFYLITAFTSIWGIIYSMGPGVKLEE